MKTNELTYGVLAEFSNPADLMHGAEKMRDEGFKHFDCHSPFPIHGMDQAMGIKRSGPIKPCSGCCQRTKASTPAISPLSIAICG